MNMTVKIFAQVPAFISLGLYPEVELLDHMVILFFEELWYCFPQQLYLFIFFFFLPFFRATPAAYGSS